MKRLDRYVLKELSVPLVIGTLVFALLFVGNDMIYIFKTYNVQVVPPLAIIQMLIFKFPFWLNWTLPIGTSLGTSLAVSRLARESEITAMRAAGIPIFRVFRTMFVVGILMGILNFIVVENVVPSSMRSYKKLVNEIGLVALIPDFRSNVMLNINKFNASFGSIQRLDNQTVSLRDVLLIERPRPEEIIIYRSPSGLYQNGIWKIDTPTVVRLKGTTVVTAKSEDTTTINEPIVVTDLFAPPIAEEETAQSFADSIRQARALGQSTTKLEVEFHRRYAVPAACLVFSFAGAVLAMRLSRFGPFMGVLTSLLLVWMYFNAFIISCEIFGKQGWMHPILAAWLPNIVFGALTLLFVRRLE
ncbi:MAG: LptF/LptG family permease [Armatimonadetes bacterium]|nr:LptF/LptG family permease [Armatimonadota bacterium]